MQRKNEDTYKIFHGMKPVKRQVRRDNQSGWYYLDPRGAENFSDMKEIGVESENSPNPKIKAILDDDMHKNPDDYYVWRTKKTIKCGIVTESARARCLTGMCRRRAGIRGKIITADAGRRRIGRI